MNTPILKPCPFCGEKPKEHDGDNVLNHAVNCFFTQQYAQEMWLIGKRAKQWNTRTEFPSASLSLEHIPASHIGGSVKDAFDRLFAYLDYVRPDAPRNSTDPYQVGTSGSYSFEDLRRIADELKRQPASLSVDEREALVRATRTLVKAANYHLNKNALHSKTELIEALRALPKGIL